MDVEELRFGQGRVTIYVVPQLSIFYGFIGGMVLKKGLKAVEDNFCWIAISQ